MADRYQDRPFPADGYGRGGDQHVGRGESDPLAELARLIGQSDPFATPARANSGPPIPRNLPREPQQYQPAPPQYVEEPEYDELEEERPAGPPPWMQRANHREASREAVDEADYAPEPLPVHPLHRYAAQPVAHHDYQDEPQFDDNGEQPDPERYDDALYGRLETGDQDFQRDPAYPDDPYADQDGYEEDGYEQDRKRRGGLLKVAAVLALAVLGTGAAFAYHSLFSAPRSGDAPIIRADNSPTKMIPAPADAGSKVPDRMVTGDATEKLVPREEKPIDVNANAANGARVVFPPLNQNGNPPPPASVATSAMPAAPSPGSAPTPTNGTLPSSEPHKIRTLTVRGDQPDNGAAPVASAPPSAPAPQAAKPAKQAATSRSPISANASANAPLSLSPQAAQDAAPEPRTRVAATTPAQTAPGPAPAASSSGGYLVQVSSQRNEADAQASFRALQGKFPSVLGSQTPVIKRADLGDKGVYYRAMVGPFGTPEEASQFCGSLKTAGGQCVVQRN
jgi:hypothetical protein